jgi:ABC-type glycerol-3-phosphate transport system substrate-binding protein
VAKTGTAAINDVVEAAKKEGAVTWLDARASQENDKFYADAFRRKYGLPDSFQVNHIVKGSGDVITQVQEEIRAGKLTVDLVWVAPRTSSTHSRRPMPWPPLSRPMCARWTR